MKIITGIALLCFTSAHSLAMPVIIAEDVISLHCETEWPGNDEMQTVCIEKQTAAYVRIMALEATLPKSDILECSTRWRADFDQIERCIHAHVATPG